MRTLLLLRHAKSSWTDPTLADQDRPLAPRGRRAARRMARYAGSRTLRPALVLCSSARRARETLEIVLPALGDGVDVQVEDDLYGADAEELLERLRAVDADVDCVLLIGHNPGLHDLAMQLAGDGDEAAMAQLSAKFPTGALATLDLGRTGWDGLAAGQAHLSSFVLPRTLPG